MNNNIKQFIMHMNVGTNTTKDKIENAGKILGIDFPTQYIDFMLETNGAEGPIGENSYLTIWSIENIAQYNVDYEVNEFNPGLVYFGSDGGGMVFAFDKRTSGTPIVTLPFTSVDLEEVELCGNTFNEFLQNLYDAE